MYVSAEVFLRDLFRSLEAVAVVDPGALRGESMDALLDGLTEWAGGIVYYAPIGERSVQAVLQAVQRAPAAVVFQTVDDDRDALRRVLNISPALTVPSRVLVRVSFAVNALPVALAVQVAALLGGCAMSRSPTDLFAAAAIRRRSGDRALQRAGMCSAGRLLALCSLAAEVEAVVFARLQSPADSGVGSASYRLVADRCRRFLAAPPSRLRTLGRIGVAEAVATQVLLP